MISCVRFLLFLFVDKWSGNARIVRMPALRQKSIFHTAMQIIRNNMQVVEKYSILQEMKPYFTNQKKYY